MADFINTIDVLGDDAVVDSIIRRTITEFHDDTLSEVGSEAFRGCAALTSVKFPAVVELSSSCFYECTSLEKADFSAVTSIDAESFNGCSALKAVTLRNTSGVVSLIGSKAFPTNGYIYVPSALADSYKTATNWSTYADQFRKLEEWTVDGTVTGELDIDNRCMVRFFNDDGTLLGYKVVTTGGSATYDGDTPVCSTDESLGFLGFAPSPTNVTVDMDCYAQYINIYTWDTVISAVQDGSYKNLYSVGDIIPLDMGSEGTFNMVIAGIDVDDLADGSGKAAITWISKELFATKRVFSPKQTPDVVYGWSNSQLRNYLNTDIKTLIPEKVRSAIKGVTKIQPEWDTTEALVTKTSTDEVWVPSHDEMFGTSSLYKPLFKNADGRRIKYIIGASTASIYWLRTQYNSYGINIVKTNGSKYLNNYYAQALAYPLCFCI